MLLFWNIYTDTLIATQILEIASNLAQQSQGSGTITCSPRQQPNRGGWIQCNLSELRPLINIKGVLLSNWSDCLDKHV